MIIHSALSGQPSSIKCSPSVLMTARTIEPVKIRGVRSQAGLEGLFGPFRFSLHVTIRVLVFKESSTTCAIEFIPLRFHEPLLQQRMEDFADPLSNIICPDFLFFDNGCSKIEYLTHSIVYDQVCPSLIQPCNDTKQSCRSNEQA